VEFKASKKKTIVWMHIQKVALATSTLAYSASFMSLPTFKDIKTNKTFP
jgi:hypothetical protein